MQSKESSAKNNVANNHLPLKDLPFFQPKLAINQPNDIYEQEADAMAEKVIHESPGEKKFFSPHVIQRKCSTCEDEEIERKLQKKDVNSGDTIIQRQDNNEPQQNGFQLPPLRTQLLPPLIPPLQLTPPFDSIDYLGLRETFFNRGVLFPGSYMDDAQKEWGRQYLFYKQLGLGNVLGNTFAGDALRFFGVKPPGGDWNAWLSNTTTPLSVDSALSNDFPNLDEQEERRGGLPAPTIFHLPEVHFKKADENEKTTDIPEQTEIYLNSLSGGTPLSEAEKNFFEPRIDADFSDVKIHNDSSANQSAKNLNALAYTTGNNIVFGAQQYEPETDEGKKLLAHELTHVVQQDESVQRKPSTATVSIEDELRSKLELGNYRSAYLQLNDFLDWGSLSVKKAWLAGHQDIRNLFLKAMPSAIIAEVYSAEELGFKLAGEAFAMIDCWYQAEQEKQFMYAQNLPLFDHLVSQISPYTGENISSVVTKLSTVINGKTYKNYAGNDEFHIVNLLAPTIERKIKFYKQYESLFKIVSKKFDPFTGTSKEVFDFLTDTDKVSKERAIQIYEVLKTLPDEQRNAFLETSAFAGSLEADKDAEKFYSKNYKAQYKALPHNWDSAIMPWNWGSWDAPFAERLTIDHVALMSAKLSYEYKSTRKFGFDTGIDSSKDPTAGKDKSDAEKFMQQLQDDAIFTNGNRLYLLLAIGVRGGLEKQITEKILQPKNAEGKITPQLLVIIESYGFIGADKFNYHPDKAKAVDHDVWQLGYIMTRTIFGDRSGKAIGEQRGTFDLLKLQETTDNLGSLGGMRFDNAVLVNNEKYDTEWLDKQVAANAGASTLKANLELTKGTARQNKIFASIRNDIKQANIYASTLVVEGLNYFKAGALYRSGPGLLQGIAINLQWTKDTSDPDNDIYLSLGVDNILLNNFQLVAPKSTLAIGQIGMKGFNISFSQKQLPAAEGLFIGLFKNADFTLNALMLLLPNVLTLLPYAVMTMTEEFKGPKAHIYKDKLAVLMQSDFSSLQSSLSFTALNIKNLYDSTEGFLDDFSIEKRDEQGRAVKQEINVGETNLWTIDVSRNIKARLKIIDEKLLAEKAAVAGSDADKKIVALEAEKKAKLDAASAKALKYENRDPEMTRLREIYSELRELNTQLDEQFAKAKTDNPLYNPVTFDVLEKEKEALEKDLDYLDNKYVADTKTIADKGSSIERYEARRRKAEFEAKYKSADVNILLRGINLHGGGYVRDMLNDVIQSIGFKDPTLKGLENIQIDAIDSSFVASGKGVANQSANKPGVVVRDLFIPLISAPSLSFRSETLLLEAGEPMLENVKVSVAINFGSNPLDKDPAAPLYKYNLSDLLIDKASFKGLTVKVGKAEPLVDFPSVTPVEAWGVNLKDYDPDTGNINLSIRDVKAQGTYADSKGDKSKAKIGFGIDTTVGKDPNHPSAGNAIEVHYNKSEDSVSTRLNIPSAWIPVLNIESPTLALTSKTKGSANAIELKDVQADVKVYMEKLKVEGVQQGRPMSIEINSLHVGEIDAQGITAIMRNDPDAEVLDPKAKPAKKTIQEVTLPEKDKISIKDINISGLRVTLADDGTTLSTIGDDASVQVGETNLSGVNYKEKTAKGGVLQAVALHTGKFKTVTLDAISRNGREYSLKEFFKFFGKTRLAGLDASASYSDGKTSATIGLTGKQNIPISIDYTEAKDGSKEYYDIRLPLAQINVPALHIIKDPHEIIIPKPVDNAHRSYMNDVDVKLRAYIDFGVDDKVNYDIYLTSLDIAELDVFGLEYHNKEKGVDVVFEKQKPLKIPNVKAGGFHFSSAKGFDVFGKAGGWVTAGGTEAEQSITASFESIKARLTGGDFLAEKDAGRSALDLDVASLGFTQDKDGNMAITLGAIHGGFPKMTISQTDPKTKAVTKTTIASTDNKAVNAKGVTIKLGADNNNVIDAMGLTAGGIKIESVETRGTEKNTSTINLAAEALGADTASVKLNADKSKEITLTNIKGGKINIDLVSEGKEKSVKNITLPDPDSISVEAVIIKIDPDDHEHITVRKPTIRNFKLRMPDQKIPGDYTSVLCDLKINGDVDMGDGNFKDMTIAAPYDAFVFGVQDNVPVEVSRLRFEYKDTSTKPEKSEPEKPLTADQELLLKLEEQKIAAEDKLSHTPQTIGSKKDPMPNPEYDKALDASIAAQKAYDDQKAKIIGAAKGQANASMTKKYLDAVEGTAEAKMVIYDSTFTLDVETYKGDKYVGISQKLVNDVKPVIKRIIGSTVNASFWNSKELIALAKHLQHWYITLLAPSARAYIDVMAEGHGVGSVLVVFDDADLYPGIDPKDSSMFGINININSSWLANVASKDIIQVLPLCEKTYKHPAKDDYYNLYGIIEYLQFVKPSLVSVGARQEAEMLRKVLSGEQKIGDLGLADTGVTLLNYLIYAFDLEMKNITQSILENVHGVGVTADVTLKPEQVINELLKEKKAGSLNFDKGKKTIDDVHVEGVYVNDKGNKQTISSVGAGKDGQSDIVIPGTTYLSEDKGTKISYQELDITPLNISYENDVLEVLNKNILLKGLKGAILKK